MSIFDARAMLGLYCYRAGYYPAALAQWTRIPERNRVLRPEIAHLLAEVDTRIALENQETQPMRRDQILREEPILAGNLPPADLPNPHEPIRNEEKGDGHSGSWASLTLNDDTKEEHRTTSPLRGESSTVLNFNGGKGPESLALDALPAQPRQPNWLARLFGPRPK